jgi:hypothetical protein
LLLSTLLWWTLLWDVRRKTTTTRSPRSCESRLRGTCFSSPSSVYKVVLRILKEVFHSQKCESREKQAAQGIS